MMVRYETLLQVRNGMHALYERHEALHESVRRYLRETRDGVASSKSRHQLELAVAPDLPILPQAIDPSAWFDRREAIEDWASSLVGKEGAPG